MTRRTQFDEFSPERRGRGLSFQVSVTNGRRKASRGQIETAGESLPRRRAVGSRATVPISSSQQLRLCHPGQFSHPTVASSLIRALLPAAVCGSHFRLERRLRSAWLRITMSTRRLCLAPVRRRWRPPAPCRRSRDRHRDGLRVPRRQLVEHRDGCAPR